LDLVVTADEGGGPGFGGHSEVICWNSQSNELVARLDGGPTEVDLISVAPTGSRIAVTGRQSSLSGIAWACAVYETGFLRD
jgi:hypothetical protein